MPIKRRRTSTSIMGMTDPGSLQAAVAAHVGRIQGAAASNVAGLQETVAAHVGGLQSGVAVHIRELQENIYRLQAALDALPAPSAPMPVVRTPPTKLPRFIAGIGIEVLQRKDFVQISAQDDPYGVLYQVTAVDTVAVTCTVRRVWQDGTLNKSSEITGVLYQAALPVAVGDQGELVRLADGKLAFVKDYPLLWQVTAVGETTCTVQMVDASGDPVAATEITGVLFDTAPSVGDNVLLARRTDGSLSIFMGGSQGGPAPLIIAKQDMTTDDTAYNCKYLEADGTEGDALTARRPNGIRVDDGDPGYLGEDSSGQAMFIPCHARMDQGLGSTMETREDDPSGPETGRHWLRTDEP